MSGGCGPEGAPPPPAPARIILVAAVALIDPDGRVLLAQRPEGKSLAGLWEFPGGKVEPGESPETALIRELHEELGIDTWHSCLAPLTFASHAYDEYHLLMPLYAWGQGPVALVVQRLAHAAVRWGLHRHAHGHGSCARLAR